MAQDGYQIEITSLKQKCDHLNSILNKPKFSQGVQTDDDVFEDFFGLKYEFPKISVVTESFKPQKKLKALELKTSTSAEI